MTLAEQKLLEAVLSHGFTTNAAAQDIIDPLRAAVMQERISPEWRAQVLAAIKVEVDAIRARREIWKLCPLIEGSAARSQLFEMLWLEAGGDR